MKRLAAGAIILVQLWLLSPVCCCWFKATAKASEGGDCCCSQPDEQSQEPASPTKDRSCRCSDSKVAAPLQKTVAVGDTSKQVRPIEQPTPLPTSLAPLVVLDPPRPLDFRDSPPPLAGPDRLYELQRLNL